MPYRNKEDKATYMRKHRKAERRLLQLARVELSPQWKKIMKDFGIKPRRKKKR